MSLLLGLEAEDVFPVDFLFFPVSCATGDADSKNYDVGETLVLELALYDLNTTDLRTGWPLH